MHSIYIKTIHLLKEKYEQMFDLLFEDLILMENRQEVQYILEYVH
jgi:hypothetical protein